MDKELIIDIKGEIINSNFDAFCTQLKAVIKGISYKLVTDTDFELANDNAKNLKEAEQSLKAAKDRALEQADDIKKLFTAIDGISDEARTVRLDLERQIKARKEKRKKEIIEDALCASTVKPNAFHLYKGRIEKAIKGKRSFGAMEEAATIQSKCIKVAIECARYEIEKLTSKYGESLVPDRDKLESLPDNELSLELRRRAEKYEAEKELKAKQAEIKKLKQAEEEKLEQTHLRFEPDRITLPKKRIEPAAKPDNYNKELEESIAIEGSIIAFNNTVQESLDVILSGSKKLPPICNAEVASFLLSLASVEKSFRAFKDKTEKKLRELNQKHQAGARLEESSEELWEEF